MWNPKRLQIARRGADLTQEELSGKMGCSNSALRGWEAGRAVPSYDHAEKLSRVLGKPMEYFSTRGAA